MNVPARYILAAIAFAIAALGFILLPTGAAAECSGCERARGMVVEAAAAGDTVETERDLMIRAICIDLRGDPHPAAQTFADRVLSEDDEGELYRCAAGARMRYPGGDRSYECAVGDALVIESGELACRPLRRQ